MVGGEITVPPGGVGTPQGLIAPVGGALGVGGAALDPPPPGALVQEPHQVGC